MTHRDNNDDNDLNEESKGGSERIIGGFHSSYQSKNISSKAVDYTKRSADPVPSVSVIDSNDLRYVPPESKAGGDS